MALAKDLPISKVTAELLSLTALIVKNMPRDLKQILGGKLLSEIADVSVLIYRANVARDKSPYLDRLLERLQVAELLGRLLTDIRCMSKPQYAKFVTLTDSIGKQANGWRKAFGPSSVTSGSRP